MQLVSKPCALVDLAVLDVNDNRPQFYLYEAAEAEQRPPEFYLEENSAENTFVAWLKAFDADAGENGTIAYRLEESAADAAAGRQLPFWIDAHGIVRNVKRIRLIEEGAQVAEQRAPGTLYTYQRTFLVKVVATDSAKGR